MSRTLHPPLIFFESKKNQKKSPRPISHYPMLQMSRYFFFTMNSCLALQYWWVFRPLKLANRDAVSHLPIFVAYICPSPISHRLLFSGLSIQNCLLHLLQPICHIFLTMKTSQSYRKTSFKGFFAQKPFGTDQNGHKFQTTSIPDLHIDFKQYRQPINTIYIAQIGL